MQFEALKVFCDVARCRSFSQAASANNLSQSAVSQIVLMLERRMGVQLINRATRPLQLTPLGQIYYEGCKGLVERYQELEAAVRQRQAEVDATIQVAAIYSVGLGDMGHYVERFEALHPGTKVHVEYLHPDRVYERVLNQTADLGLVSFPRRSRDLLMLSWRDEPMVLACSPQHSLAALRSVKLPQLAGEKFVGFDRELTIRREVDRLLREQEVSVEVVMEFDNIENIKKAVEIGAGLAILPEPTFRREVEAGTLAAIPLTGSRLARPLGIIYSRHHRLNTTILRFIDLLRDGEESSHAGNGEANGAKPSRKRRGMSGRPRASREKV
jgi:DNA-binding transcriptional LysR family regulator